LVPIIDLKNFKGDQKAVAAEIGRACEEIGFLAITGHGVDPKVVANVEAASRAYFDLSTTEKRKIPMTDDYPFGYSGFAEENLSQGYGVKRLPDLKEMFCIGPYNPKAGLPTTQWPSQPPQLRAAYMAYYQALEVLAANLLRLFAVALSLPANFFDDKIERHGSAMRVINYPALTEAPPAGQIRAGEHTDYGALTILLQDAVGGLQVRSRKGEWVDVTPVPGSFLINLGDLMARWTNDRWVSTLHRVMPPAGSLARRQSIAFFYNINNDHIVECIPTCHSATNPPKYKPVAAGAYLLAKHLASQGHAPPVA